MARARESVWFSSRLSFHTDNDMKKLLTRYIGCFTGSLYQKDEGETAKEAKQWFKIDDQLFGPVLSKSHKKYAPDNKPIDPFPHEKPTKEEVGRDIATFRKENKRLFGPILEKKNKVKRVKYMIGSRIPVLKTRQKTEHVSNDFSSEQNLVKAGVGGDSHSIDTHNLRQILTFPLFAVKTNTQIPGLFQNELSLPKVPSSYDKKAVYERYTPSVSTILDKSRPPEQQFLLDQWEANMIAKLGEAGFLKYKNELFASGKNFHLAIQQMLEGIPEGNLTIPEANHGHWQSLRTVFGEIGDVTAVECKVKHPVLNYLGYFDCVAKFRNHLCVIDWKTSKKLKATLESTYDNPLQVAAYLGAFNQEANHSVKVDHAAVVVAYEDGSPADVHLMDRNTCIHYWTLWLRRLHTYYTKAAEAAVAETEIVED